MDDNIDILTQVLDSGAIEAEVTSPDVSSEWNYLLFDELLEAIKTVLVSQGVEQILPQHLFEPNRLVKLTLEEATSYVPMLSQLTCDWIRWSAEAASGARTSR